MLATVLVLCGFWHVVAGYSASNSCLDDYLKATNAQQYKGVSYQTCGHLVGAIKVGALSPPVAADGTVALKSKQTMVLVDAPFCHIKLSNPTSTTARCNVQKHLDQYWNAQSGCPASAYYGYWVGSWVSLTQGCNATFIGDKSCASQGLPDGPVSSDGCGKPCTLNTKLSSGACKSCNSLGLRDAGRVASCGSACFVNQKAVGASCKSCASLGLPDSGKAGACGAACLRDALVIGGKCIPQGSVVLTALGASADYATTYASKRLSLNTLPKAKSAIEASLLAVAAAGSPKSAKRDALAAFEPTSLTTRATSSICPDLPPPVCADGQPVLQNAATVSQDSTNGCGPSWNNAINSKAQKLGKALLNLFLNTVAPQFVPCCNNHDQCFGKCTAPSVSPQTTLESCGSDMASCMANVCASAQLKTAASALCATAFPDSLRRIACGAVLEGVCDLEMVAYAGAVRGTPPFSISAPCDAFRSADSEGKSSKCKCNCTPPRTRRQVVQDLLAINTADFDGMHATVDQLTQASYDRCDACQMACPTSHYDGDGNWVEASDSCRIACATTNDLELNGPICEVQRKVFVARDARAKKAFGPIASTCEPTNTAGDYCLTRFGWSIEPEYWKYYCSDQSIYQRGKINNHCAYAYGISNASAECMAGDVLASYCKSGVPNPTDKCLYAQ